MLTPKSGDENNWALTLCLLRFSAGDMDKLDSQNIDIILDAIRDVREHVEDHMIPLADKLVEAISLIGTVDDLTAVKGELRDWFGTFVDDLGEQGITVKMELTGVKEDEQ